MKECNKRKEKSRFLLQTLSMTKLVYNIANLQFTFFCKTFYSLKLDVGMWTDARADILYMQMYDFLRSIDAHVTPVFSQLWAIML